jgi:hypothetical protein
VVTLEFLTVPDELLGIASAAADWLKSRGYTVTPERHETGYPYTPTLHGKRTSATALIEVDAQAELDRLKQWVAYGRSCNADTRVWCALAEDAKRTGKQDRELKNLGVGLLLVGEEKADETMAAKDLALGVELPGITTLPRRVQKKLGPVYEHFDRAEWREGFAEACLALEDAARKHLWKGIKVGRIMIVSANGKQEQLTKQKIDQLTMGQLAGRFGLIVKQSRADRVIGDALKTINPNRIGVTHHKGKAAVEAKLRRDVGGQMWLIVGALKEIDGSP